LEQPAIQGKQDQGGGGSNKQISRPVIREGFSSAPPKLMVSKSGRVSSEMEKFQYKADVAEMCLLNAGGERVQGLSSEGISISEEDFISDEAQGSQTNTLDSKRSQTMGGNSGSFAEVVLSKEGDKEEGSLDAKNVDDNTKQMRSVETTDKMVNEAPINKKEQEVQRANGVQGDQILPETRHSNRIQEQLLSKNQGLEPRKWQVEGNPKPVSNSFALLDNDYIADLVRDMGVMISDKRILTQ
jgi:hypothetical protein